MRLTILEELAKQGKLDFSNAWKNSLSHQISTLPEFENVYNKVKESLKNY